MLKKIKLKKITKSEIYDYGGIVHDLEVEEDHSYNINGIIVHNSACLTRKVAGVGMPQLSATIECADAAHGVGGFICTDGGCTVSGDIVKAFGGGADFVMLGGMFSGSEESDGDIITNVKTNEVFKQYYGMSSETAMEKHHGGVAKYKASEGRTVTVPYTGAVSNTIQDIIGGLRSGMTYIGAEKLKYIPKCATFLKVNRQLNEVFLNKEK